MFKWHCVAPASFLEQAPHTLALHLKALMPQATRQMGMQMLRAWVAKLTNGETAGRDELKAQAQCLLDDFHYLAATMLEGMVVRAGGLGLSPLPI